MYFSTYTTFYTFSTILEIIFICFLGGMFQYLDFPGRNWTNISTKIVVRFLLPCHIFIAVGETITTKTAQLIWPVIVIPIIFFIVSFLLGNLVTMILGLNYVIGKKAFVLSISIHNAIITPIFLIEAILNIIINEKNEGSFKEYYGRCILYMTVYALVDSFILLIFGNFYLRDATDLVFLNTELDLLCERDEVSETSYNNIPMNREILESPFVKARMKYSWIYNFMNLWKTQGPFAFEFKYIFYSLVFAIVVAFVRPLKNLFYPGEYRRLPPLFAITETLRTLGELAAPFGLFIIGAKIFKSFKEKYETDYDNHVGHSNEYSRVTRKEVILNLAVNLIVLPLFALFLAMALSSLNHLVGDPLLSIVVLILAISPPTLSLLIDEDQKKNTCIRILNSLVVIQQLCCLASTLTILNVALYFIDL